MDFTLGWHTLLGFIPIAAWLSLFSLFYALTTEARLSFLKASVTWAVFLALLTEWLGAIVALDFRGVLGSWSLFLLIQGALFVFFARRHQLDFQRIRPRALIRKIKSKCPRSGWTRLIITLCGFLLIGIVLSAAFYPPNTHDSLSYHMSRVMHWMTQKSVEHYITQNDRQLALNPWAEFAITHFQILSGGDYFANFIQFFSLIGCLVAAWYIAEKLGASLQGQFFAVILTATIPMAVLQASSTQNDLANGFWLMCIVAFLFSFRFSPHAAEPSETAAERQALNSIIWFGLSLGLSILTKGTSYIYVVPLMIYTLILGWPVLKRRVILYPLSSLLFVLMLNLGHYLRNYNWYGTPLGISTYESQGYTYQVQSFTIPLSIANILRSMAIHIATPSESLNLSLTKYIYYFCANILHVDPNDPRTTWPKTYFQVGPNTISEDWLGNSFHFFLTLVAVFFIIKNLRSRSNDIANKLSSAYLFTLIIAFILFSVVMKWMPWNSRIHLPLFLLGATPVAVILSQKLKPIVTRGICLVAVSLVMPVMLFNVMRPCSGVFTYRSISRPKLYAVTVPYYAPVYFNACIFLRNVGVRRVGLITGSDDPEYILWVLLNYKNTRQVQIQAVEVTQGLGLPQTQIPSKEFDADALLFTTPLDPPLKSTIMTEGKVYRQVWALNGATIFLKVKS